MEVHKHSQHLTHKKKWGEYLLEFFMLFLAVFLGFVTENLREHSVERRREKEYGHSLSNDLAIDIARLLIIRDSRDQRNVFLDSLMLLRLPNPAAHSGEIYYYNSYASRMSFRFNSDDGTLQQLKNAGNLRLISKQQVRDSIMSYDIAARTRIKSDDEETTIMETYRTIAQEIFDGSELEKTRNPDNSVIRMQFLNSSIEFTC